MRGEKSRFGNGDSGKCRGAGASFTPTANYYCIPKYKTAEHSPAEVGGDPLKNFQPLYDVSLVYRFSTIVKNTF
jgi:hypothetical protein